MKILCLHNNDCAKELFHWLRDEGHDIVLCSEQLNPDWCRKQKFELAVSYTYRFILTDEHIMALNHNVVNLHNSLLPWNRGADPNLWSIIENTPRGVTLHYVDSSLDKGYIIMQSLVTDAVTNDCKTLASSYNCLDQAAKRMFKEAFQCYEFWPSMKKKAIGKGSYHSLKEGYLIKKVIDSYDITINEFRNRIIALNQDRRIL